VDVKIIPIVISRDGTFHVKTLAEIAQLASFKDEPPDELTVKQLPITAKKIAMALHVHAQKWLSYISKTWMESSPQRQNRPQTFKSQHLRPTSEGITHLDDGSGGGGCRARGYDIHGW
jgi:hypothetical protein